MVNLKKYVGKNESSAPVDFAQFTSKIEDTYADPSSFKMKKRSSGLGNSEILSEMQKQNNLTQKKTLALEELTNQYRNPSATSNGSSDVSSADTLGKIRFAETGTVDGNYGTMGDIGDGAGLSVGAYQFTEKSGTAQKLANMLGFNDVKNPGFKAMLNTDIGRKAQDDLFVKEYKGKPDQYAKQYGINDPKIYGFMLDTNLNGGLDNVIKRANALGGINMPNLLKARADRYHSLADKNPKKFGKFRDGWIDRLSLWQ